MTLATLAACGCKSHQETLISAQPEFLPDEEWVLTEMRGREVSYLEGQRKATAVFNPEAGTIHGSNGCNTYHGNFKDHGEGRMTLSDISSTKMACPQAFHKLESTFMQLLRRCDGYTLGAYSLELKEGEKTVLTFSKGK